MMMYVKYPLSLRNVEDLLAERGIDICHETVRFLWNRFGPMFAAEIRRKRVDRGPIPIWRWHLDEVFVKINGEKHYLWRAVNYGGEVLEAVATRTRDKAAAGTVRLTTNWFVESCRGQNRSRRDRLRLRHLGGK